MTEFENTPQQVESLSKPTVTNFDVWDLDKDTLIELEDKHFTLEGSIVTAPKYELLTCRHCGGVPNMEQSEPSTANYNEGAVHYKAVCATSSCVDHYRCVAWDILPHEAMMTWNREQLKR
jgi:hypothetical protein